MFLFDVRGNKKKNSFIESSVFPTQKVTTRKGVGMVCAESDARVARTDDYESDEYELKADNEKTSVKADKVSGGRKFVNMRRTVFQIHFQIDLYIFR